MTNAGIVVLTSAMREKIYKHKNDTPNLRLLLEYKGVESASTYFGKYIGPLKSYHHALQGDVYVVDSRTLHIRNFNYDGEGPAGYFYVSNSKSPNDGGIKLRDERGSTGPLKRYRKKHITLTLPEGKTINNIKWFFVWCDEFAVNFGDVKVPKNLDFPKPQKISKMSGVHSVASDNVVVVDAQTLLIPAFSYDGEAPDAKFWVGSGSKPSPQGVRVPDENGKEEPLRKYDKKTIVLTLPGDITVFDIGYFGIWCEAFTVDFGHIEFPKDLNVPPSLKMLGVSPQKFTPSILSHFHLESPYSLYSELPESEAESASASDRDSLDYHTIQIRDTSVTYNKSNNSSSQLGYIYSAKNIELVGSNATAAHNCTDVSGSTYLSNGRNDTKPDRENIEISTKYDAQPIKLVQNDTSFEVESGRANETSVVDNNTLIRYVETEPVAGNASYSAQTQLNSTARAFQKQENETENTIEVIKSVSTEYEPLIDINVYGLSNSNRNAGSYAPSRNGNSNRATSHSTQRLHSKGNGKNRNIVYHKEDASPTVSRVIDLTENGKKVSQNGYNYPERSSSRPAQNSQFAGYSYPDKQATTSIVSKVIDIEMKDMNGYRGNGGNGYDASAKFIQIGSPFRPPTSHGEDYRTVASSLTVGKLRGDNFRTAASFTIEKIHSEGFKVTTAPTVEKFRSSEFKSSTRTPSRSRGSSSNRSEVPTKNGRPYRGGKKYRSTEKPPEKKVEVDDRREDKVDESSNWISLSSGQRLAAEDAMFLNSLDTGSFLSYDIPLVED